MTITPTGTPTGTRLPGTQSVRTGVRILQGVLAMLGVFLVVFALPVFLLSAFGTPWPDSAPSVEWLTRPITAESVLSILAAVVWLAWAHFVVCLVVEAVSEVRHRGVAPRVPGGGIGTQALARRLVTAILLLSSTAAVNVGPAMAVATPPGSDATYLQLAQAAPVAVAAPTDVEAQQRDRGLPSVEELERATRHDVQQGATTYYDVKPPQGRHYDTLWDIAERFLGDGLRYKEVWELNRGVVQPDGRQLKDADLIHPGWVMKLPADAKGPGLKVVDHAATLTPEAPAPAPSTPGDAPTAGESHAAGAEQGGSLIDEQVAPWIGVAGGLALAGVALGLRRRREAASFGQLWATRRLTAGSGPDGGPDGGPGGIDAGADVAGATWLADGLRAWNLSGPLPAPTAVSVTAAGAAVAFAEEPSGEVAPGWSSRGAKVWTLDRETDVGHDGLAPLPGLVSIGRRDDGSVAMVDAESASGVIALEGDSAAARGLALSLAVDTATHPWADERVVTMVGFADDVSVVAPRVLRHTQDIGRVLESLENHAAYQRAACRRAGAESARDARVTVPGAASWSYHLVVCSGVPATDELRRLAALASDPQVALGVVVVGSVPDAGLRLALREDGRLVAPLHGLDLVPQVLDVDAARALIDICSLPEDAPAVSLDEVVRTLEAERSARVVDEALVHVDVMGPVSVEAPGPVEEERRELLTELACLLALHPDGLHVNRITAALWPRGVDEDVRDATMSQLSAWFGVGPDGLPLLREESGVWSVVPGAVSLDWTRFRAALNRSTTADEGSRGTQLRVALDLVRGRAFSAIPERRYSWLAGTGMVEDITLAVGLVVQSLAESAVDRGDAEAARAALERGLDLLPANEDLWRSRLLLARRVGSKSDVEAVARRMYAVLHEHGSAVGATAQTDSLVAEMLPGWRHQVA